MDNLLLYLLKISAGIILFYLSYILFFSRDTFYQRNRVFLIGILMLSIVFPSLKISNFSSSETTSVVTNPINELIVSGANIGATVTEKITSFDINNFFFSLYFLVASLILFNLLISLTRIYMIIKRGKRLGKDFPMVILSDMEHPPFSFFPYIVIPQKIYDSGDFPEILRHEKAHIRQGHTFDLLLTELLIAFLWFNPFIWLIKRSMKLNHEYLADNLTLKNSHNIKEYQYKLLNITKGQMNIPLANNFSSLIKNRIIMINKKPTHNYAILKNLMILPVIAILFVMFLFKPESTTAVNGAQTQLFSKSSETEISRFLAENLLYPAESKNSSDTGRFFVVVKMKKGGIINECIFSTEKSKVEVPILEEIIVVAYGSNSKIITAGDTKTDKEHLAIKTECLRVTNKLVELQIPEWKDRDIEFALAINFRLR